MLFDSRLFAAGLLIYILKLSRTEAGKSARSSFHAVASPTFKATDMNRKLGAEKL
jgi:hypothetical protein